MKTIDEYLASLKPDQRAALQKVRRAIRATAPRADEGILRRARNASKLLRGSRLPGPEGSEVS